MGLRIALYLLTVFESVGFVMSLYGYCGRIRSADFETLFGEIQAIHLDASDQRCVLSGNRGEGA